MEDGGSMYILCCDCSVACVCLRRAALHTHGCAGAPRRAKGTATDKHMSVQEEGKLAVEVGRETPKTT